MKPPAETCDFATLQREVLLFTFHEVAFNHNRLLFSCLPASCTLSGGVTVLQTPQLHLSWLGSEISPHPLGTRILRGGLAHEGSGPEPRQVGPLRCLLNVSRV